MPLDFAPDPKVPVKLFTATVMKAMTAIILFLLLVCMILASVYALSFLPWSQWISTGLGKMI